MSKKKLFSKNFEILGFINKECVLKGWVNNADNPYIVNLYLVTAEISDKSERKLFDRKKYW